MVTLLELFYLNLKHYRVKCTFYRNFIPPFQNWTFLKMSIFQNLTTTFAGNQGFPCDPFLYNVVLLSYLIITLIMIVNITVNVTVNPISY
jgi:hypothetical protein